MSKVIMHISGPSGSGKTTLVNAINRHKDLNKKYVAKDLDDFDDEAVSNLGWNNVHKRDYNDAMHDLLHKEQQKLLDSWISQQDKPIILAGLFDTENGKPALKINTQNKYMLNTPAKESALRAYQRSQGEPEKTRRLKSELPGDIEAAEEDIKILNKLGYIPKSHKEILDSL